MEELEEEQRIVALVTLLQIDPESISVCPYDKQRFEVNHHMKWYGLIVTEARRLAELVHRAIAIVRPDAGPMTTDRLCGEWRKAQLLAEHETELERDLRLLQNSLPRINPRDPVLVRGDEHKGVGTGRIYNTKRLIADGWTLLPAGTPRRVYPFDSVTAPLAKKAAPIFARITAVTAELASNKAEAAACLSYRNLVDLFRANAETAELCKLGIHNLVNSLYFLCPDSDAGATPGTPHKDHQLTLREAFDDKEIKDRTTKQESYDGEYLVVTDDEADELWNADMDSYLEECVLHELPEVFQKYFNRAAWKKDAEADDRGQSLAGYDHEERTVTLVGGMVVYIYRCG